MIPISGKFLEIPVTEDDIEIYETIDGHKFGALFDLEFCFMNGFGGDIWGFGASKEQSILNLFHLNEEYEALYRGGAIKFHLVVEEDQ